jgi:hypothetical protein
MPEDKQEPDRLDKPLAIPLPQTDPGITVLRVALWMQAEVYEWGKLSHKHAINHIAHHFGKRFLYINPNGNPAIIEDVLAEFERLTETTVVWCKPRRYWRLRRAGDPPNAREVRR